MSSHKMPFGLQGAIHELSLSTAGTPPNRPLSHYGFALAQAGLVLTMAVAFLFVGIRAKNISLIWVSIAATALAVALAAETSRVWWNYPYPLHSVRQGVVWVAFAAFGAALQVATSHRWGNTRAPPWLGVSFCVSIAALVISARVGAATLAYLVLAGMGMAFTAWKPAMAGDLGARHLVLSQVLMLVLALRGDLFLDNDVYVLGACIMCAFVWERTPSKGGAQERTSGETSETMVIKAYGNYAHITTVNGARRLVRMNLSAVPIEAPLMRVHRSYIVNLSHARRLLAQTGSRYLLELTDGTAVPVSRRLVAELRARLNNASS